MSLLHTAMPAWLLADIRRLAVTFAVALACGWGFLQIGIPAPYLMGSLFGVWISGGLVTGLQPYLGVARWFHKPVVLGLGVLIGATFNQSVLEQAEKWSLTLMTMIVTTFVVTVIGYQFLRRIRGYEPRLAILCSVPGGQAEAIAMARDMVDRDYVVALFHLVRVVVVFVSTPLLLRLIEGQEAVDHSNVALLTMPSILDLPTADIAVFILLGVVGMMIASRLRIPMPHLIGPVGLSTLFHLMGWADLPRVTEFVILAQLAIGGAVGARLAKVPFGELLGYLKDACASSAVILGAYLLATVMIAKASGISFLAAWLAFVPGGLYEVTLLALVFGFDVAFVAFHHTVRVMLIFLTLPALAVRLGGDVERPEGQNREETSRTPPRD
jgi:membrane AbrB-like protein